MGPLRPAFLALLAFAAGELTDERYRGALTFLGKNAAEISYSTGQFDEQTAGHTRAVFRLVYVCMCVCVCVRVCVHVRTGVYGCV